MDDSTASRCCSSCWLPSGRGATRPGLLRARDGARHADKLGMGRSPSKTYMQADGVSEVVLTLVILALVVAVGATLHKRVTRGLQGAGRSAWAVSVVTLALGVLGFAYAFGVGICLLLACASVPRIAPPPPWVARLLAVPAPAERRRPTGRRLPEGPTPTRASDQELVVPRSSHRHDRSVRARCPRSNRGRRRRRS